MTKEMIMDVARTLMKAFGGYFAVHGGVTGSDWEALTGAVVVLAGLAWSWWSTKGLEAAK